MRRGSVVLFLLAVVVAVVWPLSSAIGAATASALAGRSGVEPAGCAVPDATASADDEDATAEDELLPPGHPPVGADALPPGHPPLPSRSLPPGHPPVASGAPRLPPGHPPVASGQRAMPSPAPLFNAPVLLDI